MFFCGLRFIYAGWFLKHSCQVDLLKLYKEDGCMWPMKTQGTVLFVAQLLYCGSVVGFRHLFWTFLSSVSKPFLYCDH